MNSSSMARWRQDCERVGLSEPTLDIKEIKRAYAVTLKSTRPDEDAQAYQALREAYDRLVAHARLQQSAVQVPAEDLAGAPLEARAEAPVPRPEPAAAGAAAAAAATATATTPPPTPVPPKPTPTPPPPARPRPQAFANDPVNSGRDPATRDDGEGPVALVSVSALCAWTESVLKKGPDAVKQALPTLHTALAHLPIAAHTEASLRFADLLIRADDRAPVALVHLLLEHFGWLTDFRAGRLLGELRLQQLRDVTAGRPMPVTDPVILKAFGPTTRLPLWLVDSTRLFGPLRGKLAAMLMGHALEIQLLRAGPMLLRRLGIDLADQRDLRELLNITQYLSPALIYLLACTLQFSLHSASGEAQLILICGSLLFLFGAFATHQVMAAFKLFLGGRIQRFLAGRILPRSVLAQWRRVQPWCGLAVIAAMGVGLYVDPQGDMATLWPWLALLAIFLVLPSLNLMLSTTLLLAMVWVLLPPSVSPWVICVLALWIAGAVVLLEQGLYEPDRAPDEVLHPTWPRGGWPALLLLCTVGLPVLLGWLTARCGKRLGIGAMLLTFGIVFAIEDPFWRLALTPVMLLSALGLLLVGQRLGWRAGRWLMRKGPREA